ncbi:MAG: hypothetical protein KDB63_19375, partial [Nocardioidaceae bacterium]|nr:hypothetical protein [Nocardioidaceae bacterium]
MHRRIAGTLTGPVTKWVVAAAVILLAVALSPFAAKLTDVQNNETSSWLPASAESTKALDKMGAFQNPNAISTVIAYERSSGLTPEDLADAAAQATELKDLRGVTGDVVGPIPSP